MHEAKAMKLTLSTYGGIAGGLRRPDLVVDSDSVPADAARQLGELVKAAKGDDRGAAGPGSARDAMEYEIRIEEGSASSVIGRSDAEMSTSFAALMRWIKAHGQATR